MSEVENIAKFIIDKFGKQNINKKFKIILSNNFACLELKEIFTLHYELLSLPTIIPFTAIIAGKELNNSESITPLHELLILSEIIIHYQDLPFNISEALNTAKLLSQLFNDLVINNINIKSIETYNNSKYWQKIYTFLEYGFYQWLGKITKLGKTTTASYKLALLDEEITRSKNKIIVIAGLFKPDPLWNKWLQITKNHPNVYICNIYKNNYCFKDTSIYYEKPLNIYEEAEKISQICKQNPNKKIAIITNNYQDKRLYCNSLVKYSINFQDLIGDDLLLTNSCHLILTIIRILSNDFDLKLLFLLLKNPLISSELVWELELLLSNNNRFISSQNRLLQLISNSNNAKLITYYQELINILFTHNNDISNILSITIEIAKKLHQNIWQEEGGVELLEFLNNLIKYIHHITIDYKQNYHIILYSLISNIRYYKNSDSANIVIGKIEDLALSKFDIVILSNFNNETWPPTPGTHPWLSKEAKKLLNIDYEEITSNLYIDYFQLFLNNKQVIISCPKTYAGKSTVPSNFLLKLQLYCKNNIYQNSIPVNSKFDISIQENKYSNYGVLSNIFPTVLSVTDIETLIRSPYIFYAKKILNLSPKKKIWEEPKISDFGSFIHKVFEQYAKNYNQKINLLEIGNSILQHMMLPQYTKKTWQIKLQALIKPFTLFDRERRKNCQNIYFELKGELNLHIVRQNIKIIGIADRIEINNLNQITILDYKTGIIPSKKEIASGLSPQLILEALMITEGGFPINFVSNHKNEDITIAYVKISSSEPYVQTHEIKLTMDALKHHKQGLINLLEYYISNKFFSYDPNLLKYNDYFHLRRSS